MSEKKGRTLARDWKCRRPLETAVCKIDFVQHQCKGNNYNSNRHLMQYRNFACGVAALSVTVEKVLKMWHPEIPKMKGELVVAPFWHFLFVG